MKKLLSSFLTVALVVFMATSAFAAAAKNVGKVIAFKGDVTVAADGSATAAPVVVNSPINLKDTVNTGKDGRVKLLMKDGTVISLGPKGKMVVREYTVNADKKERQSILGLITGTLRAAVKKAFTASGSKFEVHTPTAVAGVRGSTLWTHATPIFTDFAMLEGTGYARNRDPGIGGEVTIPTGMFTGIGLNAPPSPPHPCTAGMLSGIMSDTSTQQSGPGQTEEQMQTDQQGEATDQQTLDQAIQTLGNEDLNAVDTAGKLPTPIVTPEPAPTPEPTPEPTPDTTGTTGTDTSTGPPPPPAPPPPPPPPPVWVSPF